MGKKKKERASVERPAFRNNPFAGLQNLKVSPSALPESKNDAIAETKHSAPLADAWPSKLVLRRERKGRGGKTVTCLSGVEVTRRESVAKQIKKALGCGATLEGDEIVLLGSLVDRAADWLEAQGASQVVRGN